MEMRVIFTKHIVSFVVRGKHYYTTVSWSHHVCITDILWLYFVALRIHVSPTTKAVLDGFETFDLELRGSVDMKVRK